MPELRRTAGGRPFVVPALLARLDGPGSQRPPSGAGTAPADTRRLRTSPSADDVHAAPASVPPLPTLAPVPPVPPTHPPFAGAATSPATSRARNPIAPTVVKAILPGVVLQGVVYLLAGGCTWSRRRRSPWASG